MSDEQLDIEETVIEDDPTPNAYCEIAEVKSLCANLSDTPSEQLLVTAVNNSTAWINTNLNKSKVPIPIRTVINEDDSLLEFTEISAQDNKLVNDESDLNTLRTAAIYYAASDIILVLYQGEKLPDVFDTWFQKAQSFLEAYIEAYWNSKAEEQELLNNQIVKHRNALTYNQKRPYRRYY